MHFGLGNLEKIDHIQIRWPSGVEQILNDITPNRVIDVKEDSASAPPVKAQ